MWFGYRVPISVQDMLQITCIQTFDVDEIRYHLEEIIRSRTAKQLYKHKKKLLRKLIDIEKVCFVV